MAKQRVGVVFGGRSGEHEVSLASAYAVMLALADEGYDVIPIGIDKQGRWLIGGDAWPRLRAEGKVRIGPGEETRPTPKGLLPATETAVERLAGGVVRTEQGDWLRQLDVVFPVLHGPFGEDGTVQGLLELLGVPYVGAGVAGSAVCMDKILTKRVLEAAGIPQVDYLEVRRADWDQDPEAVRERVDKLGYPCFVKPANLGSSVGIAKVHNADELPTAMHDAARYDRRIIVEAGVPSAREIEISVLGNDRPEASVPGEIIPCHEFYDYEAKYLAGGSTEQIPAKLDDMLSDKLRRTAVEAYQALDVAGMARVDFLLEGDTGRYYLNELNTIPGFTPISMYPKLWAATGLPFGALARRLIDLALARQDDRRRSETSI